MLKPLIVLCDAVAAAVLAWLMNRVALIPFQRVRDSHWTERARVLYPARIGAAVSIWLLPADIAAAQSLLPPPLNPHWVLAAIAAWAGTLVGTYPFDREVFPWLEPRSWLRHVIAKWLMRFPLWFLLIGIAVVMPADWDWRGGALATVFGIVFMVWCWGGIVWVSRKLGVLRPAPERLRRIVAEASSRMGVPVRRVWLLRSATSAAFALPYTGELLFSDRLLEKHPDDEITAICAHEIGHLKEPRLVVAARVLANLAWLMPWLFIKPVLRAFDAPGALVLAVVSFVTVMGNRWLHRRLERRADHIAHANEGDTGAYARALARLYELNLVPASLPRRAQSHPDLYDRLLAVGVQPDFERPKPAKSHATRVIILCVLLGIVLGMKLTQVYQ